MVQETRNDPPPFARFEEPSTSYAAASRHRNRIVYYRPHLLALEARLPLGDAVLGTLVGTSLLGAHLASSAAFQPAEGVTRAATAVAVSGLPPTSSPAGRLPFAATLGEVKGGTLSVTEWEPLTTAFTPLARRQHGTRLPSPPREQGSALLAARSENTSPPPQASMTVVTFAQPVQRVETEGTLLAVLASRQVIVPASPATVALAQEARIQESYGKLPITFEQNVGQTDASVHFLARGPGYGLFLTSTEAVMVLNQPTSGRTGDVSPLVQDAVTDGMPHQGADALRSPEEPPAVVRMKIQGANATPTVTGRDQLPGKVNYFLGNDPAQWHTNVATFARVEVDEVYPGVDLVWYGTAQQLEYDFVVSPGVNPNVICLDFAGAERVELDAAGELVVHAGGQQLRQHRPVVYQEVDGVRQAVASTFVLDGHQVGFRVGAYDAGRELVIDPVVSYSTYLGGSS